MKPAECIYCMGRREFDTSLEDGRIVTRLCPRCLNAEPARVRSKKDLKRAMDAAIAAVERVMKGKPARRSA